MNFFKPLSTSEKSYKKGVFLLLVIIFTVQLIWWFRGVDKEDQVNSIVDVALDSLIGNTTTEIHLKPFNANDITAYKAYILGIENEAYERLRNFRLNNNYFSSLEEVQKISGISDSIKNQISPYLRFPEQFKLTDKVLPLKDINSATAEELRTIYGIGTVLSKRILAYRASLGKYDSMEQLYQVYALDSVVVRRIMKRYEIK